MPWPTASGVHRAAGGSFSAGCIWAVRPERSQRVQIKRRPPTFVDAPVRYETQLNASFSSSEQYATLAHELGHLYCGHIGTHNKNWWPARRVSEPVAEFEAESAAYIACLRVDDSATMPPHLAQYLTENQEVPTGISLERVAAAAGRVIELAEDWLRPRRTRDRESDTERD